MLSSPTFVQPGCASRGAVLVSMSARLIHTVFAACPLQLHALLEAAKPLQPALDRAVERLYRAGICSRTRHHGERQRGNQPKAKKEEKVGRA